ncbi:MAG TPA: phospholipase D-like domain-containing protein [Bdellovibrionota bacterium]|nr:phospholipase D-like domain-containing protein [Bdellovibrionota bacterium]
MPMTMGRYRWMGVLALLTWPLAATAGDLFYESGTGHPILGMIQHASASIDLEIYSMNDPRVDTAIRAAVKRGVEVRIIQEPHPVGSTCSIFDPAKHRKKDDPGTPDPEILDCQRGHALVEYVNAHGGQYVPFPKDLCTISNCLQHGKLAIFDGETAMISSGNLDKSSLCDLAEKPDNCDRDYNIVTQDPDVLDSLHTVFENDLASTPTDLGGLDNRLTVSPESLEPITAFIASAKTSLQIETQYLEDPTMNQAIIDAAKRGVKVSLMVASACSFGKPSSSTMKKWNRIYLAFDAAGATSRAFDGAMQVGGIKGYLHAKAIIVDGKRAWVGSVNGSTQSLTRNREFGIFLNDPALVRSLNAFVAGDFDDSRAESWQDSLLCKNDPKQSARAK